MYKLYPNINNVDKQSIIQILTTSLFTTLISLLKSAGTVLSLSTSKLYILVFKQAESVCDTSEDVSRPVANFRSAFVA